MAGSCISQVRNRYRTQIRSLAALQSERSRADTGRPPDIHPDEFYKAHTATDDENACHRGKGPAGPYGAETSDCDSPFSLVNATFDWIDANLKNSIDFVVWTGDTARHDRDEDIPRHAEDVLGTNTWVADKFVTLFAREDGKGMTIPVVPNFGNNDILPHNILLPGPNKWFQSYAHIWRHFIPEEQRHSFEFGGWFHVDVIPNKLAVFSLNTLYFFDRNAGVDGCAKPTEPGYKQLEWLRVQLQFLRDRGMKAILMGHVPPARTGSKTLWDETCWQKYSLWMDQFRDVVVVGLYGHMNIDHFLIHDRKDIDMAALSGAAEFGVREAMEDELSVRSAGDYLSELRTDWAKLTPPPTVGGKDSNTERKGKGKKGKGKGKKKKGKKSKDPWSENYHLTLVSPSVVPNYFPTLRVLEYNISGIEDTPVWQPSFHENDTTEPSSEKHLDLRHLSPDPEFIPEDDMTPTKNKKNHNKKKNKHNKDKKKPTNPPSNDGKKKPIPDDPNLHIPLPPSKSAPPGPAYSPQPLTLTGYTQYFANLTRINLNSSSSLPVPGDGDDNDGGDGDDEATEQTVLGWWLHGWRKGGKKQPKQPNPKPEPQPEGFAFEVEYSTFDDGVYKLKDLRVGSLVELALRIGVGVGKGAGDVMPPPPGKDVGGGDGEEGDVDGNDEEEDGDESDEGDDDNEGDDDEVGAEKKKGRGKKKKGKKGKGKKGKKGKGKPKENKTWLHFLRHAFVCTVEKDELKKFP